MENEHSQQHWLTQMFVRSKCNKPESYKVANILLLILQTSTEACCVIKTNIYTGHELINSWVIFACKYDSLLDVNHDESLKYSV